MTLPEFPSTALLPDLQAYQQAVNKARGWNDASIESLWLLFTEEVGELAKAIRHRQKLGLEVTSEAVAPAGKAGSDLAGEFADVFSYLIDLASRCGVDLETAYRDKEAINAKRVWE